MKLVSRRSIKLVSRRSIGRLQFQLRGKRTKVLFEKFRDTAIVEYVRL
jgi:hypothetical protein